MLPLFKKAAWMSRPRRAIRTGSAQSPAPVKAPSWRLDPLPTKAATSSARAQVPDLDVRLLNPKTLPPRFEATLSPSVVASIESEINAPIFEGRHVCEMGGFLVSYPDKPTRIVAQSGPGPKPRHRPASIRLDLEHAKSWAKDRSLELGGQWHTHPDDGCVPSKTDLQAWANACFVYARAWVGIIATRGELGFTSPRLNGWITRHVQAGWYCCEPLHLVEE